MKSFMNILYKMFKLHTFILNLYINKNMLRETGYIKLSGLAGLFMALKKGPP